MTAEQYVAAFGFPLMHAKARLGMAANVRMDDLTIFLPYSGEAEVDDVLEGGGSQFLGLPIVLAAIDHPYIGVKA